MAVENVLRRAGLTALLLCGFFGCSSPVDEKIRVAPGDRAPACAGYLACIDSPMSFSECAQFLDSIGHWNPEDTSLLMGAMGFADKGWITKLALAQNARCVARAGADCAAVLACLNQGSAVSSCTSSSDHIRGSVCRDEKILEGCTNTGIGGENVLASVRCGDVGLECLEISLRPAIGLLASCADREKCPVNNVNITCDGSVASIQMDNAVMRFDCAFAGAECRPGEYPDITALLNTEFCKAAGPGCTPAEFTNSCEGNTLITCIQGQEAHTDCALMGQICRVVEYDSGPEATCTYSCCDPNTFDETCEQGVITYCAEAGMSTFDCTSAGFAGCVLDGTEAACAISL